MFEVRSRCLNDLGLISDFVFIFLMILLTLLILLVSDIHAPEMDEASIDNWLISHHYTFINYYAPWCVWCQRLAPVWEAFAEKVQNEDLPVSIVRVDCVANSRHCTDQKIQVIHGYV